MNINIKTLNKLELNLEMIAWFDSKYNDNGIDIHLAINDLISSDNKMWAMSLIVKLLSTANKIKYSLEAAKLMTKIFEIESNNGYKQSRAIHESANSISYAIQSELSDKNRYILAVDICSDMSIKCAYSAANSCSDVCFGSKTINKLIEFGVNLIKEDLKQGVNQ